MKFDLLGRLKGIRPKFDFNPLTAVPVAIILLVVVGYGFFFITVLSPSLASSDKLTTQLANAQKSVSDSRKSPVSSPEQANAQLVSAKATLAKSLGVFLSDSDASGIIDALYQYSTTSGVVISNLQTQPATGQTGLYSVSVMRLQVQGSSSKLIEFCSRIRETFSSQGFVINNLGITGGDQAVATLSMDVALYTTSANNTATPAAAISMASGSTSSTNPPAQNPTAAPPQPTAPQQPTAPPSPIATSVPALPTLVLTQPTAVPPSPTYALPTPIPPSPPSTNQVYVVKQGDTLYSISVRYGVPMDAIGVANQLTSYSLKVGQSLQIPPR
jgi:LysM repeat protein